MHGFLFADFLGHSAREQARARRSPARSATAAARSSETPSRRPGSAHRAAAPFTSTRPWLGWIKPGENAQQRALAGPAAPQQRDHLSRRDVQRDVFQDGLFAARRQREGLRDLFGRSGGFVVVFHSIRSVSPSRYLLSARSYSGLHTAGSTPTTNTLISPTPRTIRGQSPLAVASEMYAPSRWP